MLDATKGKKQKNLLKAQTHSGTGDTSSAANVDVTDLVGVAGAQLNLVTDGTTDTATVTIHDDEDNTLAAFSTLQGTADDKVLNELITVDLQAANGGKVYANITADGATDTFTAAVNLIGYARYYS